MKENYQLELARNFIFFTDKNIFLTGKAGTGKTTFLKNLRKECPKRMAIVAPTGVAAINAGGVTIHSFFQLPFGPYVTEALSPGNAESALKNRKFNKEKIKLIQSLDLLVIDEISMVRADVLDGIDEVLRRYRNKMKPFGGIQLLMIGDLHQLSPVVRDEDWKILRPYYSNLYFFSSKALQQSLPVCIELKHIYRQSDEKFIEILNKVRENRIDDKVLDQLNQRYIPDFNPSEDEGYIILTTHNNTAQEINNSKLKELESKSVIFTAAVSGDFPEFSYPTDASLELKVGAQVMFVKNDSSREKLFYNGKIGKITKIDNECIFVKCPSDLFEIEVLPVQWENLKYELNTESKEVDEKTIGTFTQHPLKLAWAITIHKSQGLTFERAIIDAGASFAHGQVYVALSRCKSFEGMVLSTPIRNNSVKTDGTISSFTKEAEENCPGEEHLTHAKASFQHTILLELFDFKPLKTRLYYLIKLAQDHSNILSSTATDDLDTLKSKAEKEVFEISQKFLSSELSRHFTDNSLIEENENLQQRINKASSYFLDKVEVLFFDNLKSISFETDNKAINKSFRETLTSLEKECIVKQATLKAALKSFSTIGYLRAKANAEIDHESTQAKPEKEMPALPKNIKHSSLYNSLKRWRDDIASNNNVPVYIILPSKVINDLCEILPANTSQLESIKGIGKQKVKVYGKDILKIINSYCRLNNIKRDDTLIISEEKKVTKTDTKRVSFELFQSGLSVAEIAKQRNLAEGTIESHLIHFIESNELDLFLWIDKKKAETAIDIIQTKKLLSLNEIKAAVGEQFSFGELRAILKHLQLSNASESV